MNCFTNEARLYDELGRSFYFKDGLSYLTFNNKAIWYSIEEFEADYCTDIQDDDSYLKYLISLIPEQFKNK